jgi:hypothetical protein
LSPVLEFTTFIGNTVGNIWDETSVEDNDNSGGGALCITKDASLQKMFDGQKIFIILLAIQVHHLISTAAYSKTTARL